MALYITLYNKDLMNGRKEVKIYLSFFLKTALLDAVMTGIRYLENHFRYLNRNIGLFYVCCISHMLW